MLEFKRTVDRRASRGVELASQAARNLPDLVASFNIGMLLARISLHLLRRMCLQILLGLFGFGLLDRIKPLVCLLLGYRDPIALGRGEAARGFLAPSLERRTYFGMNEAEPI